MDTLVIIARKPEPGLSKTRLQPKFSPVQAAALYEGMLRDTLELARQVPGVARAVVYAPAGAEGYFARLAPDFERFQQQGETLGERLDHALRHWFDSGSRKAVIMDSDSPTLPVACLVEAFSGLDRADVTLGPTEDGGYYLIGLKRPAPRLLREVRMSTPRVLADTLALAEEEGLRVHLLREWYDVDNAGDVERLAAELHGLPVTHARYTRGVLGIKRGWARKTGTRR